MIFGLFGFSLALILQLFGKLFHWRADKTGNQVLQLNNDLLEEENELQFDGFFSFKTWKFLIPAKRHWINILVHSMISGVLMMSCSCYLLKSTIQEIIGKSIPAEIAI